MAHAHPAARGESELSSHPRRRWRQWRWPCSGTTAKCHPATSQTAIVARRQCFNKRNNENGKINFPPRFALSLSGGEGCWTTPKLRPFSEGNWSAHCTARRLRGEVDDELLPAALDSSRFDLNSKKFVCNVQIRFYACYNSFLDNFCTGPPTPTGQKHRVQGNTFSGHLFFLH